MKLSLYFTALVNAVPNKKKSSIADRNNDIPDVLCADMIANNGLRKGRTELIFNKRNKRIDYPIIKYHFEFRRQWAGRSLHC